MLHLEDIDPEGLKRISNSPSSRSIKRAYIKQGYDQQMSFYGTLFNKETGKLHHCRIEVLSDVTYTERIVFLIYETFKTLKPPYNYTIWIYNHEKDSIQQVAKYGFSDTP